jgi:hypothetical protein
VEPAPRGRLREPACACRALGGNRLEHLGSPLGRQPSHELHELGRLQPVDGRSGARELDVMAATRREVQALPADDLARQPAGEPAQAEPPRDGREPDVAASRAPRPAASVSRTAIRAVNYGGDAVVAVDGSVRRAREGWRRCRTNLFAPRRRRGSRRPAPSC